MSPPADEIPELRVPLGGREPRGVAVVVRGHKLLVMARVLDGMRTPCCRAAASTPARRRRRPRSASWPRSARWTAWRSGALFDGDHGGRAASYVLVDAPEGEPVLGGPEAEAQSEDDHYQPLWVDRGRAADARRCCPRASPTWSSTRSGRCGSTSRAPTSGRCSSGSGSSTSTTSRSSGTAPPDPTACSRPAGSRRTTVAADRSPTSRGCGDVPCGFALVRGVDP